MFDFFGLNGEQGWNAVAIPHAIAMVRAADKKSPREAVEFVLQLLKYNDNNGNPYSDVFWLAALVQSVGELEFGQQSILFLSSLLKRVDRLLQFDRLMPSYNGILTVSCIRTLTQIALKLSGFICLVSVSLIHYPDHVVELIKPFRNPNTIWQVRMEASRALLDLEFHCKGIDAALSLFVKYIEAEPSLRGQEKLGVHAMRICQAGGGSDFNYEIRTETLVALLHLLDSRISFNNVFLRHHLFGILQILAGRAPTLYGVPRDKILLRGDGDTYSDQRNICAAFVTEMKPTEPTLDMPNFSRDNLAIPDVSKEVDCVSNGCEENILVIPENSKEADIVSNGHERKMSVPEVSKDADTVSNSHERKMPVVNIRVKQSAATSRAEEADNRAFERSQGGQHEADRVTSSSVSVDAPQRNSVEAVSISYQNVEEVNSCHDHGSRMTASIGSAKLPSEGDNFGKELQCTADSSKVSMHLQPDDPSSPSILQDNNVDPHAKKYEKKKKDKEKKRKREDPEYLEKKRLKKEKKQKEKEMTKLLSEEVRTPSVEISGKKGEATIKMATVQLQQPIEPSEPKATITKVESRAEPSEENSLLEFLTSSLFIPAGNL
ncbi:hypothetical protein Patl1_19054 [Pistacia atlantica]|uniref:Uncharacterized protein n=1 Tax=Pistacia atlantica TaxID=434234 RepID=A0ACC1C3N8_9ROSI|nr:hypothetical protein Patl1_19054 [Pistacia atlantica]